MPSMATVIVAVTAALAARLLTRSGDHQLGSDGNQYLTNGKLLHYASPQDVQAGPFRRAGVVVLVSCLMSCFQHI